MTGAARLVVGTVLGMAAVLVSCSQPLPEAGSPQAILYETRCSGCHRIFQPSTLGPSMWKFQMENMDKKYLAAGARPPTAEEKAEILEYLLRNSGGS